MHMSALSIRDDPWSAKPQQLGRQHDSSNYLLAPQVFVTTPGEATIHTIDPTIDTYSVAGSNAEAMIKPVVAFLDEEKTLSSSNQEWFSRFLCAFEPTSRISPRPLEMNRGYQGSAPDEAWVVARIVT